MKRIILTLFVLPCRLLLPAQNNEFELKVTLKPFKNQYIYLGHYFGKTYPIIDSAMLNDKSEAVFKRAKKLNGGIYLIGFPGRNGFFEILVDKQQRFSIVADTSTLAQGAKYTGSPDNVLFTSYQQTMQAAGKRIKTLQDKLKTAAGAKDSAAIKAELEKEDKAVTAYREGIIKDNEGSFLSALLTAMREPVLTGRLKDPKNKADSLEAYNFYKSEYWNGVNFWDGRLAYTPFFDDKMEKYYNQLVQPHPDSVIKEIDYMMAFASINEEMTRFLLIKFVNRYLNQKYMWEDAVFVHLFEKYFATKTYSWLNEKGRKTISDRAYSLMANLFGTPAADIDLPDSSGKKKSLYSLTDPYTVVLFWDAACGHCKETLPRVDSIYKAKWKSSKVKIYAIGKETDGTRKDWLAFINQYKLEDWVHVYYSKADNDARVGNNIPSYFQLYDVQTVPALYLLDKDKRIRAKKIPFEQIDEVLQHKLKSQ